MLRVTVCDPLQVSTMHTCRQSAGASPGHDGDGRGGGGGGPGGLWGGTHPPQLCQHHWTLKHLGGKVYLSVSLCIACNMDGDLQSCLSFSARESRHAFSVLAGLNFSLKHCCMTTQYVDAKPCVSVVRVSGPPIRAYHDRMPSTQACIKTPLIMLI